jgi:hypothetical protein
MGVVTPKIPAKVKGFLQWQIGKILIPKRHYFSLSNEESKLILAGCAELAQLHSSDLGTDAGGEFLDFTAFGEEIFESRVCAFAVLGVRERFQGRIFLAMVPGWEVLRILHVC